MQEEVEKLGMEKSDHFSVLEKSAACGCWTWEATHQRCRRVDSAAVTPEIALIFVLKL